MTPGDVDGVHAPAFAGSTSVAGHPPAQPALYNQGRQIHRGRDEATRVAAPSSTPSNWATPIGADCAVIAAKKEAAARINDVVIGLPLVNADLQHAAVKREIRIHIGRFEIEIMPECQLRGGCFEDRELYRVEPFVAYYRRIINERRIRW